jgi:hypothetical protein
MSSLLAPSFLFRFAAPCRHAAKLPSPGALGEEHRLPYFSELDGRRPFADVRLGWSDQGIGLYVRVEGKQQAPWCRDTKIEDSDGIQFWIDARDTKIVSQPCPWAPGEPSISR